MKRVFANATEAREAFEAVRGSLSPEARADAQVLLSRWEAEEEELRISSHALVSLLPSGWFKDYLMWCVVSEAPFLFHFCASVSLFSHLIGKKHKFELAGDPIYAPLNTFLVSPAGCARRGQTISQLMKIADLVEEAEILADSATPEGIRSALLNSPRLLIISEEAGNILSKRDFQRDVVPMLCRLLDCPPVYKKRLKSEALVIEDPSVNVIFSSSPAVFQEMPSHAIGGGLWSRLLVVYASKAERVLPFPFKNIAIKEFDKKRYTLASELRALTKDAKEEILRFDADAERFYSAWYRDTLMKTHEGGDMSHWYSRKPAMMLRLLMALLAGSGKRLVADKSYVERSIEIINLIEEHSVPAYRHATMSKNEKQTQLIIDLLYNLGGWVEHSYLYRKLTRHFKNAKEFKEKIEEMRELGMIVCAREKKPGSRKSSMFYILKQHYDKKRV